MGDLHYSLCFFSLLVKGNKESANCDSLLTSSPVGQLILARNLCFTGKVSRVLKPKIVKISELLQFAAAKNTLSPIMYKWQPNRI